MNQTASKVRILIVEDEGLISMMIEDMLAHMGHEVAGIATRVDDALRAVEKADFGFAVLDVNLGGVASYPVADALRQRRIPFVFSTGYGAAGLAPGYGDVPTLQKPFSYEALEQAVQDAAGG